MLPMSEYTGLTALIEALSNWRRNVSALLFAVVTLAVAAVIGSSIAYYTSALLIFMTWMVWFVLTGIDWVKRADF